MVVGHSNIPEFATHFIYAFHMPLFFFASGWCTNWDKYSFIIFFSRKFKTLIIPFLVYSMILALLLYFYVPNMWMGTGNLLKNGWGGFALWFVPVLFASQMIGRLIMSCKNTLLQNMMAVMMAVIGGIMSFYRVEMVWQMSSCFYGAFLIILGSKLKCFKKNIDSPSIWQIIFGGIIVLIISSYYCIDMASNNIFPVIPKTVSALSGILFVFSLSSFISKKYKYCSLILQNIGKETYIVVAFSQIIIVLVNEYFTTNFVVKYFILCVGLVAIRYIKDLVILHLQRK